MIAALCAVSALAYLAEARLKFGALAFFGATLVAAFVALVVAGALPALLVWIVPDLISRYLLRREPRFSPGLVATISSYALALLAGAALLQLAGEPARDRRGPDPLRGRRRDVDDQLLLRAAHLRPLLPGLSRPRS